MSLYIVPVPIGNLKDITLRAVEILRSVEFIITEDTAYSRKLLNHLGIKKMLLSYYRPREAEKVKPILQRLPGQDAALITDSGTPLISDPGFVLISKAIENGIPIIPLPGPTAFVPVLAASGINPESFLFLGFPPRKKGKLESFLKLLTQFPYPLVFYESPRRAENFLRTAFSVLGNRRFCLGKEISKKHEKLVRDELQNLEKVFQTETLLGEMVIVIEGKKADGKPEPVPEIRCQGDIFLYFKGRYGISKNAIKRALMNKK